MIEKLGVQLYTIRNQMGSAEEIRESFRKLKKLGYDQGQTAGCQIPYAEFGQIAREEGIEIVGTHDDFDMMVNDFDKAWENHQALGTKIMGIGGLLCRTPEELRAFIEKANAVGAKAHARGGKFTYHHHSHEFIRWDGGVRAIDMLVGELDPETTSFVLDTYWVQHGGGDVRPVDTGQAGDSHRAVSALRLRQQFLKFWLFDDDFSEFFHRANTSIVWKTEENPTTTPPEHKLRG